MESSSMEEEEKRDNKFNTFILPVPQFTPNSQEMEAIERVKSEFEHSDITNDSKGAQLDPSELTFLGLDDNRLCRWDMRDRRGIVQNLANAMESPVLDWTQGHQFARGFYSKSSMRMAKTAFPGLGSSITHVDVTFDGKWILGTTDTYLILISSVFKDKDGKEKTDFSGRMGQQIAAPRLNRVSEFLTF